MTPWESFQAYARQKFDLDQDDADELSLTLTYQYDEGLRKQRVFIRTYDAMTRPMIEIRSAFGTTSDYDAGALLKEALSLPIGGIASHEGVLLIVHKEPLRTNEFDTLAELIFEIGWIADSLERKGGLDRF